MATTYWTIILIVSDWLISTYSTAEVVAQATTVWYLMKYTLQVAVGYGEYRNGYDICISSWGFFGGIHSRERMGRNICVNLLESVSGSIPRDGWLVRYKWDYSIEILDVVNYYRRKYCNNFGISKLV